MQKATPFCFLLVHILLNYLWFYCSIFNFFEKLLLLEFIRYHECPQNVDNSFKSFYKVLVNSLIFVFLITLSNSWVVSEFNCTCIRFVINSYSNLRAIHLIRPICFKMLLQLCKKSYAVLYLDIIELLALIILLEKCTEHIHDFKIVLWLCNTIRILLKL